MKLLETEPDGGELIQRLSVQQFLDALATGSAVPGGGAAAAATGAAGAALIAMVCKLTLGRKQYRDVETKVTAILDRAEARRAELTGLVEEDGRAYAAVMLAYQLPAATESERTARTREIQRCLKWATRAPVATAQACAAVIDLAQEIAACSNQNAVGDAAAGAACAQAGLKVATLNALLNLTQITDEKFAASCRAEVDILLRKQAIADEILETVKKGAR